MSESCAGLCLVLSMKDCGSCRRSPLGNPAAGERLIGPTRQEIGRRDSAPKVAEFHIAC
jgi:hypothetical protein